MREEWLLTGPPASAEEMAIFTPRFASSAGSVVDGIEALVGAWGVVDGPDDDGHVVGGDLVEDFLAVGHVVEDHLEVKLLRQLHDGLHVVALVDADDDGALAFEVGDECFQLEVALGFSSFLRRVRLT